MQIEIKKLYLIYAREIDRVKIGLSADPESRIRQLQTGSPVKLELFAFKPTKNTRLKESELHKKFMNKHIHGEWFQLEPIDYVNLLKQWKYDPGIHYLKRNTESLSPMDKAYISFDSKSLCKVEILEFNEKNNCARVKILEKIGRGAGKVGDCHGFFLDEVRKYPIDALINRVTL